MLLQLSSIPITSRADGAHERLLARVDSDMGDVAFTPQKALTASFASKMF